MNVLWPLEAMKARHGHHLSIVDFESALPRTLNENSKALRYVVEKVNFYIDKGIPLDNLSLYFIENQCWIKITTKAINGIYGFKVNVLRKGQVKNYKDVISSYDDSKIDFFTIYNLSNKQDEPIVPLETTMIYYVYDADIDYMIRTSGTYTTECILSLFDRYKPVTINLREEVIERYGYTNTIIKESIKEFKETYEMRVFGFSSEFRYLNCE
jgi:hypothetical protein